jgi:hypothetical protein
LPTPQRKSLRRQINSVRTSLNSLSRALARLAPALEAAQRSGNGSGPGRRIRLSAPRLAALKLQGRYMGYIRSLKPMQKARVRALRETKGIRPAIALARRLASE